MKALQLHGTHGALNCIANMKRPDVHSHLDQILFIVQPMRRSRLRLHHLTQYVHIYIYVYLSLSLHINIFQIHSDSMNVL